MQIAAPERQAAETDETLVARVRRGEVEAFDRIVSRHKRAVYGVCRRLLRSHEDADEAAQIAFVRAWKALGDFRGEAALGTWLIRIALNVAKSTLARRRVHDDLEAVPEPQSTTADSETLLGRSQARQRVRRAVAGLPPRQREVVVLKVFSEMTHREVATAMGLSEGAVKAHLHQAVANLRRRMAEGAGERRA